MGENGREDGKLNYQVRVMVIWMEKFETMGTGTLNSIKGFRSCAKNRMIFFDMVNVGVVEGMD